MRNLTVLLIFLTILIISIVKEPIADVIDTVAGGTNPTYSLSLDSTAGASTEFDDDERDDD